MNKILIAIIIIILAGVLIYTQVGDGKLGGGLNTLPNSYAGGVSNGTTTVIGNASGTAILARNPNRLYAVVCAIGSSVVWINETSTAPATGSYSGYPIASSTGAYLPCYVIDSAHPYTGAVYGNAIVSTTISYTER